MKKICSVKDCDKESFETGLCSRHYQKQRYWENPEKARQRGRERAAKNKEYYQKYSIKYRAENREKIKKYREKNREEIKEKRDVKRHEMKFTVMKHYSKELSNSEVPCCRCCGEKEFLIFLTIDHIRGRKNYNEGPKRLVGKDLYRYLQKNNFPEGYQVLCMNCNSAKSDYEVCPHQRSNNNGNI